MPKTLNRVGPLPEVPEKEWKALMIMNIVNLTKWEVNLILPNGKNILVPPSGEQLKVKQDLQVIGEVDGIPVNQTTYSSDGESGLPPKRENTVYLVSVVALQSLPSSRDDFFTVDKAVKDESGNIVGHRALSRPSIYGA